MGTLLDAIDAIGIVLEIYFRFGFPIFMLEIYFRFGFPNRYPVGDSLMLQDNCNDFVSRMCGVVFFAMTIRMEWHLN